MLTALQADVLAYLIEFRQEHQVTPTRVEIADRFGWQSANSANAHIKALERKGFIRVRPNMSRGIFVVQETA